MVAVDNAAQGTRHRQNWRNNKNLKSFDVSGYLKLVAEKVNFLDSLAALIQYLNLW